jgi:hypothetical protein
MKATQLIAALSVALTMGLVAMDTASASPAVPASAHAHVQSR